jgi:hypothetical protein
MASILELFGDKGPKTSQINKKGDKTPISVDGGLDLANEANLAKARQGKLNSKFYSDSVVNK